MVKLIRSLIIAHLMTALVCVDCDAAEPGGNEDETSIRNARLAFNQAIREQDIDAIGRFFAPDYHIITGRSQQSHGVAAERNLWASVFAADPTFVCRRDTRELRINHDWGLAEELGDWNCSFTAENEPVHYSGVYSAKWQRAVGGSWLIQSEVFTTLACDGNEAGCKPPDPIKDN
jgi:ketosteroid isomerase-like protein